MPFVERGVSENSTIIDHNFTCGKRYFDGQICGQPGHAFVLESMSPMEVYVRCKDHSQWGDEPFKGRITRRFNRKYNVDLPQVLALEEFVVLLVMSQ